MVIHATGQARCAPIAQLEFQKVIGGHGGVQQSPERTGQLRAYLEELLDIVFRAKQDGAPLERLQQTVTPASLKTLQGGYTAISWPMKRKSTISACT